MPMSTPAPHPEKRRSGWLSSRLRFILAAILVLFLLCLPRNLFRGTGYSLVVNDRNGELLGARIASDGQWRFPPCDTVPEKFAAAIVEFEDRWFRLHPGVNPVSFVRAAYGNLKAGRVTSGGSTITMQVIRMSRRKERTLWQKIVESVLAMRLELRYSKDRILAMYASHAPFGGNVVGIDAASWRYFGHPSGDLSWGEAAALAVLPNSPSSIHPGRNREKLLLKRNSLLERLYKKGLMDRHTLELALDEPLPDEPLPLPSLAPHLVDLIASSGNPSAPVRTTLDASLQRQVEALTDLHCRDLSSRGIRDLAAIIVDVRTGEVLAYVGNSDLGRKRTGSSVDILRSPRSTGSILKPFLYCAMLQDGDILPYTLLPDTPVNINGFSPKNYNLGYSGAVPASVALSRSLNVPSVHELRKYGVPKFLELLRSCGMTTLKRQASDYGLSLILGGAEGTLSDIVSVYASMAHSYLQTDSLAAPLALHTVPGKEVTKGRKPFPLKDKAALWYVFDALKEVNRPDEIDWRVIPSVRKTAWKTGTSYGFRDAWAVGVDPCYAVGVWAGNASGEGTPGLTGAQTAGPVMFDIFNLLPKPVYEGTYASGGWFLEPLAGDCVMAETCTLSGYLKGPSCDEVDTLFLPRRALSSDPCPYHKTIKGKSRFILPPAMEWYYKQEHPEYQPISLSEATASSSSAMEFIYPEAGSSIYLPRQLDGSVKGVVFTLAHRDPSTTVYWHLDDRYVGETSIRHTMTLIPSPGPHSVTAVDLAGNSVSVSFTVADNLSVLP